MKRSLAEASEFASLDDEQKLNAVFAALADPSRRRILGLLREADELSVNDIAKVFEMSLNGVSKHIKVLERAGLLKRRVEGRVHFLRPNWESLQDGYRWLHFHHALWGARLDALVDYATQKKTADDDLT